MTKQIRDDIINKSLRRKRIRFGEDDRTLKIKQHDQLMTRNYFEKRLRGNTSEATLKKCQRTIRQACIETSFKALKNDLNAEMLLDTIF